MGSIADLFIGPILTKIIDKFYDYLEDQLSWQGGMKEELERLRDNYPKIQAVVSAANEADIIDKDPALNKWIWQLRDAIDEAEDLLDDFEYKRHEEQLAGNTEETTNMLTFKSFIFKAFDNLGKVGERAFQSDPDLIKLQKVVQKLDRVSAEVSPFLKLIKKMEQVQREQLDALHKIRETGSSPTDDLIGRGKEEEFILQWLRNEHQTPVSTTTLYKNISLLSIVGLGGMGKTTLLQHVYEKDEITQRFDLKMWVCVSHDFDAKKVIRDMLESLDKNMPFLESLHALQESLKSVVKTKKFLLVLDDIWEEDEERDKWKNVFAPLAGGGLGSKILLTTRTDSVASMISKLIKKKKETLILEGLQRDDCLQLLTTHAFADVETLDNHQKLISLAEELVTKLSGSPLAAKVVGGVLSDNLDEGHWRKMLTNYLNQNGIFSILKLSYIFLPKPLQNCFTFCSIFPQDYVFKKFDLVRMWIAVGFIQPSNIQEETLEDIGERYFDILVKKSFFGKVNITEYKMHDILHDLAQFVSKQECFRDVGDEELLLRSPKTIRHLSIKLSSLKVLIKMGGFKNLRTLCITVDENFLDFLDTFNEIFEVTKSIRLLNLQFDYWEKMPKMIPEGIVHLTHLRFLRYEFYVTPLPRSLSKLYHLQFLTYDFATNNCDDDFFPWDMHNLSNLRYLSYRRLNFSGVGKLKFLQQVEFYVGNDIGYRIEELKDMNDIFSLQINQLENLRDATEATNAKLCCKRKLTFLSLDWGGSQNKSGRQNIVNPDLDESVFDNLQPHEYLKKLHMKNYMGVRSSVWMNEAKFINNLEEIDLCNCLEWEILPRFGQLPFLKILSLSNMPKVKRFDNKFLGNDKYCDFRSLQKLQISALEDLEDLFDHDAEVHSLFPCLTFLQLQNCSNLKELSYLPPKLKTLVIVNIRWRTLNFRNISEIFPLKTLSIYGCQNITFISIAGKICTLAMLKTVKIVRCPNLITLLEHQEVETSKNYQLKLHDLTISDPTILQTEPLRSVTSIKNLTFSLNFELISFSFEAEQFFLQVSSSLRVLTFRDLTSLQSLPSSLINFSSLKILELNNLRQLQELPDIPASVEDLSLYYLKSLQCLPSNLSNISSLKNLTLSCIPLKSLPELPPSLRVLQLKSLKYLECLPSCLPSPSSLVDLTINKVPLLRELPNLPPSLCKLGLGSLDNLECLPSCLSNLSCLTYLSIFNVPRLHELPNLPPSLKDLEIMECDPELMKRYEQFQGFRHLYQL